MKETRILFLINNNGYLKISRTSAKHNFSNNICRKEKLKW